MNGHVSMKELPITQRPYERFEQNDCENLTDAELLAIVLRSGSTNTNVIEIAEQILRMNPQYPGLLGLHHATVKDLTSIHGVGRVKAIQLLAVAHLALRMSRQTLPSREVFRTPEAVARYYMESMRHLEQEQIRIVLMDTKSRFIRDIVISKGTVNASLAAPRDVYFMALKEGAVNILMLHNHPSGDPTPSEEDKLVTERMKQTGEIVGIPLIDHIVIGDNCFVSFRESGFL